MKEHVRELNRSIYVQVFFSEALIFTSQTGKKKEIFEIFDHYSSDFNQINS